MRLANALKMDHEVEIFRIHRQKVNESLVKKLQPGIVLRHPSKFSDFFLRKVDRIFSKLNLDFAISHYLIKSEIKKLVCKGNFDIVHSHLFKTDFLVASALKNAKIPFVLTIHGDYLNFSQNAKTLKLLNFEDKLCRILDRVDGIVCISDKQIRFLHESSSTLTPTKLTKIYNGFEYDREIQPRKEQPFVFGMVARGIPEKGWETCIEAFLRLKHENLLLILVGDSSYLNTLKQKYSRDSRIHFVGFVTEPITWISKFHVGLLPSSYASESLPTSIIEYLYVGIPVIASDVGEISNMIKTHSGVAGTVLPPDTLTSQSLAEVMELYLTDRGLYNDHANAAKEAFTKFNMKKIIGELECFYKSVDTK